MTRPDYKALCAELAEALDVADTALLGTDRAKGAKVVRNALNRARAALAKGETGPSDEELLELAEQYRSDGLIDLYSARDFARAVLAHYGSAPRPVPTQENADD